MTNVMQASNRKSISTGTQNVSQVVTIKQEKTTTEIGSDLLIKEEGKGDILMRQKNN